MAASVRPGRLRPDDGRLHMMPSRKLKALSVTFFAAGVAFFALLKEDPEAGVAVVPSGQRMMSVRQALEELGCKVGASREELKHAFRTRIREVHPDVTGDDGTKLKDLKLAYKLVTELSLPQSFDGEGNVEGMPAWAANQLDGVGWSADCESYAAFLEKPDFKALAVGEYDEIAGVRPWGAAWSKRTQQDANSEALALCRQFGIRCRLVYVGTGNARQANPRHMVMMHEQSWWETHFQRAGSLPGFGWMPEINTEKEKVCGYKTLEVAKRDGFPVRVKVPVFKLHDRAQPYYYCPTRPKEKVYMKKSNFIHKKKHGYVKVMERLRQRWT